MYPTIGGALAMNIHGKNHFKQGHPRRDIRNRSTCSCPRPAKWSPAPQRTSTATFFTRRSAGSAFLGVFTKIVLQMMPGRERAPARPPVRRTNLAEMFAVTDERIARDADYVVGWVDTFASRRRDGAGVWCRRRLFRAGRGPRTPAQSLRVERQNLGDTLFGVVPKSVLWRLLKPWVNDTGMRLLSALRYKAGAVFIGQRRPWTRFAGANFLLDYVPNWKRAYGSGGLIQYQTQIPERDRARKRSRTDPPVPPAPAFFRTFPCSSGTAPTIF
jgi:hypothetical protein